MFKQSSSAMLIAAFVASGCASIIHGNTQSVGISSEPEGAAVSVNGKDFGSTPTFAELERDEQHVVSISLPGYRTQRVTLTKSLSGWVWGNIIFGGIIGVAVDAGTGSLYKLTPEQLMASLDQDTNAQADVLRDGLFIQMTLTANDDWEQIGELQLAD